MNFSRTYPTVGLAVCAASVALALSACSSDKPVSSPNTSTGPASAPAMTAPESPPATMDRGCPTQAPAEGGPPDWTLNGATGSVAITGSTDNAAPVITVTPPFSVSQTQVHTLHDGNGPVVAPTATVTVCYLGVNGRDGKVFDSAYERGTPAQFPLDGVVPGFQKAIAGQKVGSTVGVAMASADGYPDGQPRAGIQKGDSLVFAIKILSAGR
ncbi:FKBP-type peptidyl-prolyl cis-trans isomerase [Mycobacterium sp.]|uniref:FKBP-type peptidyl-prolyl cis-trans isomerase n=1 Tax=Mycobacterium sp. TaxID=1785 RepID=UPI0031DA38AD